MLFNPSELEAEIKLVQQKIIQKRQELQNGLDTDLKLRDLKRIYTEIKDLERHLEFCFEEANAHNKYNQPSPQADRL